MIAWLAHNLCGYLLVELSGFTPERFLNLCAANRIEIWGVTGTPGGYRFYITVEGFKKGKPFARKSKVRLRIVKRFGLPFFLYRNRKRKLFFAGLSCFFGILFVMSLFIWDIRFEGNHTYTYDTLINFFESRDITYGMRKKKVDCEEIESALRTEFSEITWVSARVSGTRLLVQIKENEVLSSIPQTDTSPCDLVAEKPGVITGMIVRGGVPMVAVGDEVEQGQVLVSGVLTVTDDSETVVNTHYVHADADIMARTSYDYEKKIPIFHQTWSETGRTRKGIYLKAFDFSMLLIRPRPADTKWNMVTKERQLKLFRNFYLPVYTGYMEGKEYVAYEAAYTEEEKKELAERLHEELKKKLLEKGVHILENNVRILDNESYCRIVGHLETEEEIGRIQSIAEPKETEKPDERSGDNH